MVFPYGDFWIDALSGNAQFSCGKIALYVPSLQELSTFPVVHLGDYPTFAEKDEKGDIQTFIGLQNFYLFSFQGVPVYIMDNHNHALAFRYREYFLGHIPKGVSLLHIDQHSDMNENSFVLDDSDFSLVTTFVNERCNVGNFISPAKQTGLISDVQLVLTESKLHDLNLPQKDYILDIDLDFRAPEMGNEFSAQILKKIRTLISHSKGVTIATSPFFLDQKIALNLLLKFFG